MESIPIRSPNSGKVVGNVKDGEFKKVLRSSIHLLRYPQAWCLDAGILSQLEEMGVTKITIEDLDTKTTYRASLKQYREVGFTINRGSGKQIGLGLKYFSMETPLQRRLI